jgi:putative flavoprotein involved in K+ transport
MNGHIEQQSQRIAAHLEHFDTVIIGGGQAGLATGYHLAKRGLPFVILDANERIGDAWRKRWDSLRLFTPARYDGLQDWRFPAPAVSFPTKDEMADYLEAYAARFELPVRTGVKVDGLSREGDRFIITSGDRRFEAKHVVVATGANQVPKIPAFADELHSSIMQLHSSQYHRPSQLQEGVVLVVGAGNSGAEIAFEVSRLHPTYLSGKPSGQIPVRHGPAAARFVLPVVRFVGHHVLTLRTPIGRKAIVSGRLWVE